MPRKDKTQTNLPRKASVKKVKVMKLKTAKESMKIVRNSLNASTKSLPYAHALAMPFESMPLQLPVEDQCVASTVSKIHTSINLDWQHYDATTSQIEIGQQLSYLFMNPLRAIVFYTPNSNGYTARYQMEFEKDGQLMDTFETGVVGSNMIGPSTFKVNPLWLKDSYVSTPNHNHPHGPFQYCGTAENRVAFWVDAMSTSVATCYPQSVGADVVFDLIVYILDGDTFDVAARVHCDGTGSYPYQFTLSNSGYYALEVITGNTLSFSFAYETACSYFCHQPIPQINTQLTGLMWTRINAASLLYTNTAASMAKNGNIIMAQLQGAQPWTNYIHDSDALASHPSATTLGYETGGYGFWKPRGVQDFEFTTMVTSSAGTVDSCYYPLIPQHDYLAFFVQCSNNDVTGNGTQATLVPCWHIEFSSSNRFHLLRPVTGSTSTLTRDLQKLRLIAQFHENPLHISDIMNALKTTGRTALKYAPSLLKALSIAFPEYATFLQPAARIAGALS